MAVSNALPLFSNLIEVDNASILAAQVNIDDISILLKIITKVYKVLFFVNSKIF